MPQKMVKYLKYFAVVIRVSRGVIILIFISQRSPRRQSRDHHAESSVAPVVTARSASRTRLNSRTYR